MNSYKQIYNTYDQLIKDTNTLLINYIPQIISNICVSYDDISLIVKRYYIWQQISNAKINKNIDKFIFRYKTKYNIELPNIIAEFLSSSDLIKSVNSINLRFKMKSFKGKIIYTNQLQLPQYDKAHTKIDIMILLCYSDNTYENKYDDTGTIYNCRGRWYVGWSKDASKEIDPPVFFGPPIPDDTCILDYVVDGYLDYFTWTYYGKMPPKYQYLGTFTEFISNSFRTKRQNIKLRFQLYN